MLAYFFPGQGTQHAGMGKLRWRSSTAARQLFSDASDVLKTDFTAVCFGERTDSLATTLFAQQAIFVCNAATLVALREAGLEADVLAGHSVGEMSALYAAGAFSLDDGLRAIRFRGELMQRAPVGAMSSIVGLPLDQIVALCDKASDAGRIVVGLHNGPKHFVVSGAVSAVERAEELARDAGAMRLARLPTDRAFHSPLMAPLVTSWKCYVDNIPLAVPTIPIVLSTRAMATTQPDDLRHAMVEQFTSAIHWTGVVETLCDMGVRVGIEVGDSKTLRSLNRMIDRRLETHTTYDTPDLRDLLSVRDSASFRAGIAEFS